MLSAWLGLTDDERIPVPISTQDEMGGLWGAFDGTMQLDLDGATQLLGKVQVRAIKLKREIGFVLSQLDAMPSVGLFETREAYTRDIVFFSGKKAFESLGEPVREHLHTRCRNSLTTSSLKGNIQVILGREGRILLILLFHGCQHVIVDMARFDETLHEQMRLCFLRIEAIFKRSHVLYFIGRPVKCQVVEVSPMPRPQTRNVPYIPRAEAQGFTARFDKWVGSSILAEERTPKA